jgi:hypothetical protein
MKLLITAVIALGLGLGVWQIYQYWEKTQENQHPARPTPTVLAPPPIPSGDELPGLPQKLQSVYDAAQQRGAAGLRDFLATHAKEVSDPRLASIQLDYVLLVTTSDLADARRVFAKVKDRIQPGSPIYSRVQQMATTYQ